jgi:predicted dehydrogenase
MCRPTDPGGRKNLSTAGTTRRQFLAHSIGLAALAAVPGRAAETLAGARQSFRAAIIGHTGHGNYGHEHDLVFNGRNDVQVVAVADADAHGRTQAATRSHALRSYADYRQMLDKEKPNLVCIAPRWTDEHYAMALAALRVGAHLYLEKPITQTLAEADELLAVADRAGLKIVVAHQMHLAPNIPALKTAIQNGLLGELLEIRSHGKQDHRAGGEDLIVLGVHLFDLMRLFAGDPLWCAARVSQAGHEITLQDAHPGTEGIGRVAGDEIEAEFAFASGIHATFVSRAKCRTSAGPWGMDLIGSKASVRILMEMVPRIYVLSEEKWTAEGKTDQWHLWAEDPTLNWAESERSLERANVRVVDDWLRAVSLDRQPVCSGYAGMKALEMAMAVFAAGLARARVDFPMKNRQHPLRAKPASG